MTAVAKILQSKPDATVHTISPAASVLDALQLMADKGIGALIVTEGASIVGIFTERDYARKIALMGRTSAVTQVKDVMTSAVMFVRPDQTRAVYAAHEQQPPAPPARGGWRQAGGHDFHWRPGQGHHLRAEIHH